LNNFEGTSIEWTRRENRNGTISIGIRIRCAVNVQHAFNCGFGFSGFAAGVCLGSGCSEWGG
jgi:hypothetical protein